jgi:hypothetical protein
MKRRKRKFLLWFISLFVLITSVSFGLMSFKQEPPLDKIEAARNKISKARDAGAEIYAQLAYKEAGALYDSAISHWKTENEKFFLSRNYTVMAIFADAASTRAEESEKMALTYSTDLKKSLEVKMNLLKLKCALFEDQFKDLPMGSEIRKSYTAAKMTLTEAEIAYKGENYNNCFSKLKSVGDEIDFALTSIKSDLEDYFEMFKFWSQWANETIEYSKSSKEYVVLVDKFAKKLMVYKDGKQINSFDVELGKNWIGHKLHKGDKATPEGKYRVVKKKDRAHTKYYKALLLNFPNENDKKRFDANKKNGTISKKAQIGGLIEIHGDGGRGIDWTEGCVALTNEDMDWLFKKTQSGTLVTIIGSMEPLSKLFRWQ